MIMILTELAVFVFLLQSSLAVERVRELGSSKSLDTSPIVSLDVFQVQAPVRSSYEGASCEQTIIQHNFAASYDKPFVGTYTPPQGCIFNSIVFNMSVSSIGINFDRLGFLFLGDVEVWRLTTAMPVRTGIFWNFQKDVSAFHTLLCSEQTVIMQLDNIYNDVFTASYNVTVTALYYNDNVTLSAADLVLPISSQSSSQNVTSALSVPDQNATISLTLPKNAERAIVSVLASGFGEEEFWFTNIPTEYEKTFNNTVISGYSAFREVQILIDGVLAGVGWPYPTIFTGGISPGLWVPIVGINTYDLPSFEVDISPWLGHLCNGQAHSFQLKVVGYDSETILGNIGLNWWVTGRIFVWIDNIGNQTTGTDIHSNIDAPSFEFTPTITSFDNANSSLFVALKAERNLSHTSTITTSTGSRTLTWSQSLTYTNIQNFTAKGYNNTLYQITTGTSSFMPPTSVGDIIPQLTSNFSYPFAFDQSYGPSPNASLVNSTLSATLSVTLHENGHPLLASLMYPTLLHTPYALDTHQNGSCIYGWNNTYYQFAGAIDPARGTIGATEQWFSFEGPRPTGPMCYARHVRAVDGYEPVLVLDDVQSDTIHMPEIVPWDMMDWGEIS